MAAVSNFPAVEPLLSEENVPYMDAGGLFFLGTPRENDGASPFIAVLACPRCGSLNLITEKQFHAGDAIICGGNICSAEFWLNGDTFVGRPPQ